MPQGKLPHLWSRQERLEVHRSRKNGSAAQPQPEDDVAHPEASAGRIASLVEAYHAASDEAEKDRLILLLIAAVREDSAPARRVCRYCFAPLANGAAFCSAECEDAAWDIVPTINGRIWE